MMARREFTINGRFEVVENEDPHGTWTVHDLETGKRLSGCARTLGDVAEILAALERQRAVTLVPGFGPKKENPDGL